MSDKALDHAARGFGFALVKLFTQALNFGEQHDAVNCLAPDIIPRAADMPHLWLAPVQLLVSTLVTFNDDIGGRACFIT